MPRHPPVQENEGSKEGGERHPWAAKATEDGSPPSPLRTPSGPCATGAGAHGEEDVSAQGAFRHLLFFRHQCSVFSAPSRASEKMVIDGEYV
jgi:hypothetical protein